MTVGPGSGLTSDGPSLTIGIANLTERPDRPERPVNAKRLRFLARRHAAGQPPRSCTHDHAATPCDAALVAAEVARIRAWAEFASDLLDAMERGLGWRGRP